MSGSSAGLPAGSLCDVLVVGGGPAGAATAAFLAGAGVQVTLLDRARFPRPKPCAEFLSPQSARLLDSLGVLPAVAGRAAQLVGMQVRPSRGATIVGEYAAVRRFRPASPHGFALPRRELDELLLRRAAALGAHVIEGERVLDLVCNGSAVCGVRSLGSDGVECVRRSRLVVGADGLRSIVARRAGLARTLRWPARLALVTHYSDVAGVGAHGEMLVEEDGYLGLAAIGGGLVNVALVVDAARGRAMRGAAADFLTQWIARHPAIAARFQLARRRTPVLATGPFASRATRSWTHGLALVGDAADFFDPFTGEGIYSALLGAEALAQYARRALAGDAQALQSYDRWRRREFSGKWRLERIVALAVSHPRLMAIAARGFSRRPELAHLLVGVTGDFVPAREVLRPGYVLGLLGAALGKLRDDPLLQRLTSPA
ncbi:MAG: NAD(P)/FAD-dependent oxidoreductase [Gemmatimonadaceae bacterium]